MPLAAVVDDLVTHLQGALAPPPALLGGVEPAQPADLPAVVLALAAVTVPHGGVGRIPQPFRSGALRIDTTIDLANPVLVLDGEEVPLLSGDRLVLHLPHGPLVRADGTATPPFTGADLSVRRGNTTFTVVDGAPAAGEVHPDPDRGELTFGAPLPATGTLRLGYFVGIWEVRSERYAGELGVAAFAADGAAIETLTRQLDDALAPARAATIPGLARLEPTALGAAVPVPLGSGTARRRELTYSFDAEREVPLVPGGGGVVVTVAVVSRVPDGLGGLDIEELEITREGTPT